MTRPTLVGAMTVDMRSSTWISVNHPAGATGLPDPLSYEYSDDDELTWVDSGVAATNFAYTGLTQLTPYTLCVRAKDSAGEVSTPALKLTVSTTDSAPTNTLASLSGAVAEWLLPVATLETLNEHTWVVSDFPPHAYGAVGFKVFYGQPPVAMRTRSEVAIDGPWGNGSTYTYLFKFMVPAASVPDPLQRWCVFCQFHDQPNTDIGETWEGFPSNSPPIAINFGQIDGASKLTMSYGAPDQHYEPPPLDLTHDVWHDMALTVNWSTGDDGSASLVMDGVPVWAKTGRNMHNDFRHFLKFGWYRHDAIEGQAWIHFDAIDAVSLPRLAGEIAVVSVSMDSISITHSAGSGGVVSYRYSHDAGATYVDGGSLATAYTFTGLDAATSYELWVLAKNAQGLVSLTALKVTQATSPAPPPAGTYYATPGDYIARFGLEEAAMRLADEERLVTAALLRDAVAVAGGGAAWNGGPSAADMAAANAALVRLMRQLEVSSNLMDGYLRRAVTLPLPAGNANAGALQDCCLALTRYGLADDDENATEHVTRTYDKWMDWLKDVSRRLVQLVDEAGAAPTPTGGTRTGQAGSRFNWGRYGGVQ